MEDTTKEKEKKDGMKKEKKNDHDTLDTRRTDEVDLPIPGERIHRSFRRSRHFITESKTQRLKHNSHRNDGRGSAPLFAGYSPRRFTVVTVDSCGMSPSLLDSGLS